MKWEKRRKKKQIEKRVEKLKAKQYPIEAGPFRKYVKYGCRDEWNMWSEGHRLGIISTTTQRTMQWCWCWRIWLLDQGVAFLCFFFLSFGIFYENCLWNWEASELCERLIFILRTSLLCVYNFIAHIRHPNMQSCKRSERKILLAAFVCIFARSYAITSESCVCHYIWWNSYAYAYGGSILFVYCSHAQEKTLLFLTLWMHWSVFIYLSRMIRTLRESVDAGLPVETWKRDVKEWMSEFDGKSKRSNWIF